MDSYWAYAHSQNLCESTYEYFERYLCYLDEYPYYGFQFHELITHFLDGMLPEECYMLRIMAGRPMMDCTPEELWCLIKERAAATRPCMEYNSEQTLDETDYQETFMQTMYEVNMELAKVSKQIEEAANCICGPRNAPEPVQITVDDDEEPLLVRDQNEEDIVDDEFGADGPTQLPLFDEPVFDEEVTLSLVGEPLFDEPLYDEEAEEDTLPVYDEPLYDEEEPLPLYDEEVTLLQEEEKLDVVPIMCREDVPMEEWNYPPCSDTSLEQNLVITRNPIISPLSQLFLSYNVQNDKVNETLCKNQVKDQVLGKFCMNWKTRKKSTGEIQYSVKRSNHHSGDFRPALAPIKLRPNWKKCKKGKYFITNLEFSMFSVNVQKNRASFGWKPGWKLWKNASHNVARKVRKEVRKYDGIHPWAPNILEA